ncbi:MAG TPA: YXWGXW repeat-containing protein [Rhodocyclaceae bacterium]
MKNTLLIAAGLAAALGASFPAMADGFGMRVGNAGISIGVDIGTPPPPMPYEAVPGPRPGFVWAQGYWTWDGYRYVWMPGHWIAERPGYMYAPGFWIQRGPRWFYQPEHWEHRREERREERHHDHDRDRDRGGNRGGWHRDR